MDIQTTLDLPILDLLFAISRVVAHSAELKPSFDEITLLIRQILYFDLLLIHQAIEDGQSQIIYAKTIRFDKEFENQLEWEELLANLVYTNQNTILQQPNIEEDISIGTPHFLGIPLTCENHRIGSLVLIRTGTLPFTTAEVVLMEFIAQQIAILMRRKHLQDCLMDLENQCQQSIIQEDFISSITHELRNPLGFIKGYATTLLRSDIKWDEENQAQFLKIIDQETDRLSELIDNLLDSARLQSGQLDFEFQLLRFDALVKDVVERTRLQDDRIKISLDLKTSISLIVADARRISQVIENLISNAIKHAPGSDIKIFIDQIHDGVTCTIKDDGPGIPDQFHEKIFERFFRVPDKSPNIHGSGLGLYISNQIVQAHHGKILVKSKQGQGAEFVIYLPFRQ